MVVAAFVSVVFPLASFAQDVGFQNIDKDDFKNVVGDFSVNSLHTTVSGTLGDVFGFEIGLVGGLTNTPEIDKLAKQVSSGIRPISFRTAS